MAPSRRKQKPTRKALYDCEANSRIICGAAASLDYKDGYPTVVNDNAEAERFFRVAPKQFGHAAVQQSSLIMAGEDFSYYLREVPGCFMLSAREIKKKAALFIRIIIRGLIWTSAPCLFRLSL